MTTRGRVGWLVAAVVAALALASAASAHAYIVKTVPQASVVLTAPPPEVALTFDEAVEPRFATISVTDAQAHQQATGPPTRSPSNPDTLVVPLKPHLPEGWYLVYWRAISVDGHPVQGAFTFAIGPNQGPAPQFVVPKISQTATTTRLLIARWAMFLTVMAAIGLFVLRIIIARPVAKRVEGSSLRKVSLAFVTMSVLGLIAIPVYLDVATSVDSLRSAFAVGALVPLFRVTAFGRAYVDLEICFALFCVAAWIAVWLDRPANRQRTIAELGALVGALLAAAAVLLIPGAAGHAAQTAPRGLSLLLDWLHLVSGSVWMGGLIGLLVLWWGLGKATRVAGLGVAVPRFSNVAFVSVLVLLGSGIGATIIHMPTIASLWQTSYGKAILVKSGLLAVAMLGGAVNLLITKPRLEAAKSDPEARRAARTPVAQHRAHRDTARRLRTLRGRGALEPGSAGGCARQGGLGARSCRSRQGCDHGASERLHAPGAGFAQQGCRDELVRPEADEERSARAGSRRHTGVRHARHADGEPGVPADRDETPGSTRIRLRRW